MIGKLGDLWGALLYRIAVFGVFGLLALLAIVAPERAMRAMAYITRD